MVVSLPILPVLQKTLEAGPCSDLAFVTSAHGKPFTKESFGNAFSEAALMAGVKNCHGLRKIAAALGVLSEEIGNRLQIQLSLTKISSSHMAETMTC